ncbi:hypothetical protein GQ457_04G025920 [Hibiscus cannabinus]
MIQRLCENSMVSCTEAAQIGKAQEASKQNIGLVFLAAADGRVYQQEGRIKVNIKDLKPKRIKDYLKYKKQPKVSCFIKRKGIEKKDWIRLRRSVEVDCNCDDKGDASAVRQRVQPGQISRLVLQNLAERLAMLLAYV